MLGRAVAEWSKALHQSEENINENHNVPDLPPARVPLKVLGCFFFFKHLFSDDKMITIKCSLIHIITSLASFTILCLIIFPYFQFCVHFFVSK